MPIELFHRPLIFVAHPDDETLAFGGLLQRFKTSLVIIATDGAPTGCGLERTFGSLKAYADLRFQEASRVFSHIPQSSFKRLTRPDGTHFNDQHLFEELPAAAISLRSIAQSYLPDAIVSHAYEGGHIDHDACSFLALHLADALSLPYFEFPLYWFDQQGKFMPQQFRETDSERGTHKDSAGNVMEVQLSDDELIRKNKMLGEYESQPGIVAAFEPRIERLRLALATTVSFSAAQCSSYTYQPRSPRFYHRWRRRLPAKVLLKKFAEFENWWQKENWPKPVTAS